MKLTEHLSNRNFDQSLYSGVLVDETSGTVTFPLWNLSGQMVGYQQYKPGAPKNQGLKPSEQKYFTYTGKVNDKAKLAAFGVERLNKSDKLCFVAEGVFDVAPLHLLGVNALGLLTSNPKHLKSWLHSLGYTLVALCEGDKAGKQLSKYAHHSEFLEEGCDPGDMPLEWFKSLVLKYNQLANK
ncbi:MAG: hypothetical protein CML20_12630 [Rheinheimera sp.]|nr:hypothetical protein [Rheinheimera sp.]